MICSIGNKDIVNLIHKVYICLINVDYFINDGIRSFEKD